MVAAMAAATEAGARVVVTAEVATAAAMEVAETAAVMEVAATAVARAEAVTAAVTAVAATAEAKAAVATAVAMAEAATAEATEAEGTAAEKAAAVKAGAMVVVVTVAATGVEAMEVATEVAVTAAVTAVAARVGRCAGRRQRRLLYFFARRHRGILCNLNRGFLKNLWGRILRQQFSREWHLWQQNGRNSNPTGRVTAKQLFEVYLKPRALSTADQAAWLAGL